MNHFKIGILLSLPLFYAPLEASKEHSTKHIALGEHNENLKKTLESLDGIIINGDIFAIIFNVRNKIHAILFGDRDKQTNRRIGHYVFKDKNYSILELAAIESNYVGDAELNLLLAQAKNDFESMVGQFIEQAKGTKDMLEKLIKESCYRRNRNNSILLTWAGCRNGHETVIFHTEVQSFKTFAEFCQDLENYLMDLMYSCPIAREQYKENRDATVAHNK